VKWQQKLHSAMPTIMCRPLSLPKVTNNGNHSTSCKRNWQHSLDHRQGRICHHTQQCHLPSQCSAIDLCTVQWHTCQCHNDHSCGQPVCQCHQCSRQHSDTILCGRRQLSKHSHRCWRLHCHCPGHSLKCHSSQQWHSNSSHLI
jgi:hypothetical protein